MGIKPVYDPLLGKIRKSDETNSDNLNDDEVNAIRAAANPSNENPMATIADINSALTTNTNSDKDFAIAMSIALG